MSHPQGLELDEVKKEDNTDWDWDLEAKQMREDEDERRGKDMEEHFTREPESFGGSHYL